MLSNLFVNYNIWERTQEEERMPEKNALLPLPNAILESFIHSWIIVSRACKHSAAAAAAAKSLQSCPILCDPRDGSPPGSPVPGILQARTLEWIAIAFSNAWKWKVKVKSLSRVRLLATPWTPAYQAPPSMGFSRQDYWSGVPLPSPCRHSSHQLFDEHLLPCQASKRWGTVVERNKLLVLSEFMH